MYYRDFMPRTGSKFFDSASGDEFRVKGIAFYPRANTGKNFDANSVDWFTDDMEPIWQPHLEHLKALGINTIRLYAVDPTAPHDKFMCELSKLGIYAFVGMAAICEGCYVLDTEAPKCYTDAMFTRAMKIYNAFAVYDNVIVPTQLLRPTPPFAAADPGRYGIGYFTPDNCDHEGVPCKYNKYPEFTFLADAFKTTKPSTINSKSFVPTRTTTMTCPANFPTVALPPTPKVPILECSVYQPKCNGGLANKQQRYTPDNSTTGAAKLPFGAVARTTLAPNAATTNGSGTAVASAALLVLVSMLAMTI
ncbi:hypothetical protein DYB37_004204 [Aphanomyces astaci]|uniref:1,3-beta-glucanosyltransferase n=1 Tax=Aphanomyces astaci TaxID=112090 RepID=A0A418DMU0_APHAT|nr:hypothetical protein DYB35_003524 [Aphanomyces astaci]RHZ20114.1 hypothetical protein DYB37_004204 [Aphanomyces astaci]